MTTKSSTSLQVLIGIESEAKSRSFPGINCLLDQSFCKGPKSCRSSLSLHRVVGPKSFDHACALPPPSCSGSCSARLGLRRIGRPPLGVRAQLHPPGPAKPSRSGALLATPPSWSSSVRVLPRLKLSLRMPVTTCGVSASIPCECPKMRPCDHRSRFRFQRWFGTTNHPNQI